MICPTCGRPHAFDVLDWLAAKGYRLGPIESWALRHLFEHAAELPRFADWLDSANVSGSTIRWRMSKKGLPSPQHWHTTARALAYADAVREQDTVSAAAHAVGFAAHDGICQALRRTFDVTATEARAKPGDRWLMDRWWNAQTTDQRRAA